MRHRVSGRHLGRTPSHRRALRRNMAASLFTHGAIRTTEAKGKELRRFVEKLITTAKKGTLHARRLVIAELQDHPIVDGEGEKTGQTVVQKLFAEIAPRYADRPGGYTRIIRLADRRIGDAGRQVLLQLVEETGADAGDDVGETSRRKSRAAKRIQAAEQVADKEVAVEDDADIDTTEDEAEATEAPDESQDDGDQEQSDDEAPAEKE